jgi:hypothetical protein
MNEKNGSIEYEPLRNVLDALAADDDRASEKELRDSLRARGFEPDELVSGAMSIVEQGLREHRLAWQEAARQRIQAYRATQSRVASWLEKTKTEIDQAVAGVLRGEWGLAAQAAFRGRKDLTTDDKAKILNDLERLRQMGNGSEQERNR